MSKKADSSDNADSIKVPDAGSTTVDDKLTFEPQRLSYQSADALAHRIARRVAPRIKDRTVIIAGTALLGDFANLSALHLSLDILEREYSSIAAQARALRVPKGALDEQRLQLEGKLLRLNEASLVGAVGTAAAAVAAAAGSPVLGAALGLIGLLKQDVEYHGVPAPIDSLSFDIALAGHIREAGASAVVVPDLAVIAAAAGGPQSLNGHIARVEQAKFEAWSEVGPLIANLLQLERQLDELTAAANLKDPKDPKDPNDQKLIDAQSTKLAETRRNLEPLSLPLERADQKFADLQTQWSQQDAASGLSTLARLLRAERLRVGDAVYLHAAVVASGGHHRISHSLLRMILLGDGLSFAGGAIARWALLNEHGEVQSGGMMNARETSGLDRRNDQPKFG
jgi:hypothetical protein